MPITVEYWNIKDGYQKPVKIPDDNFLGFFIPEFGKMYDVCIDGECTPVTYSHPSGLTGARFKEGLHDGWDIFGWFDTDCGLHLFEDGTYTVRLFRDGKYQTTLGGESDATVRFDATHDPSPAQGDYYAHVNPSTAVNEAGFLQKFHAGEDIGTMDGNHLHLGVMEYASKKFIDPVVFWEKGSKTCAECPVPEPASLFLFGVGLAGLAGIRHKRKEPAGRGTRGR
ncbi:PEP-CTERM sorting domain-containing protein [Thiovibrio sp. JS02]